MFLDKLHKKKLTDPPSLPSIKEGSNMPTPEFDMSDFIGVRNPRITSDHGPAMDGSYLYLSKATIRISEQACSLLGVDGRNKIVNLIFAYSPVYKAFHIRIGEKDDPGGYHFYTRERRRSSLSRSDIPRGISKHHPMRGVYQSTEENPNIFVLKEDK